MTSTKTRKPRKPRVTETDEHRVIAAYFRKIGLGGYAIALHLRNERDGAGQRIQAHRMGVQAGLPDWVILDSGRALFAELKPRGWKARRQKSGAYTPHERRQLDMHARLRHAGCPTVIVETLDELLEFLVEHGVPLRTESLTTERLRTGFAKALARTPVAGRVT